MWVVKFKKTPPLTFIEIFFQDRIRLSRMKIYNYNEKNKLEIGTKTIDIYLDDNFYKTIFIKQGIEESVNNFITLNNDNFLIMKILINIKIMILDKISLFQLLIINLIIFLSFKYH